MTHQLEHTITRLNEISGNILDELNREQPSLETIKARLKSREEYLQVLGEIQHNEVELELAKKKMVSIRPLFDTFVGMNEEIQKRIAKLVDRQIEILAKARKQRKVQESYAVSKTPDISYF
jgi:hypothetical protein